MTPTRLAAAAALLALVWPGAAAAQRHTAVLGFRSAPEGLSVVTLAQLNTVLWQRIAAVTEPAPLTEQQVAATLGTAALRNCASDTCMVQLGRAAGLARIVWGWGMPTPQGGYSLIVRVVDAAAGPLGQEEAGCPSCSEADMLAYFSAWDASTLAHATGLRSEPAAVPQPPPPPPPVEVAPPPGDTPVAAPPLGVPPPMPPPAGPAGTLSLDSKPKGAQVLLGGLLAGLTPLKGVLAPVGEHEVTVRMEGYEPAQFVLAIVEGKTTKKKVKLTATFGQLTVISKPSGADVRVGGRPSGSTPIKGLPLAPGTHTVVVALAGYENEQRTVVVQAGKKASAKVKLRATHGKVDVLCKPKGATVAIDGKVVGSTPLKGLPLAIGAHEVKVSAPGYAEAVKVVKVKRGKTAKVKLKLKKPKKKKKKSKR